MIYRALHKAGGVNYLARQAEKNPPAFLMLVGKILPLLVTGKDGGAVAFRIDAPEKETREQWLERQRGLLIEGVAKVLDDRQAALPKPGDSPECLPQSNPGRAKSDAALH